MLTIDDYPRTGRFKRNGSEKKTSPKTLFRQSIRWKTFRQSMIAMNGGRCEMCSMAYPGARAKMLQVHHHEPEFYEVLNPAKFSVLCASCHDLVERFVTMINGRAYTPPDNFQQWMAVILPHLSLTARRKAEAIIAGDYVAPVSVPKKTRKTPITAKGNKK